MNEIIKLTRDHFTGVFFVGPGPYHFQYLKLDEIELCMCVCARGHYRQKV